MQTFLPYPSFIESAKVLDSLRLNKQCLETKQILKLVVIESFVPKSQFENLKLPWSNHPAVKMWYDYSLRLLQYQSACVFELCKRNKKPFTYYKKYWQESLAFFQNEIPQHYSPAEYFNLNYGPKPNWLGNSEFHLSHQSNLLRKNFEYYSQYFDTSIGKDLAYVWPK